MGQKVNPHGLRVGVIKDWDSRWYAREDKVGDLIVEDYNIRKYLKSTLYAAGIAKIEIERDNAKVKINIHCSRPGDIIAWRQYNQLEFIQCACRFTENCTICDNGGGGSKRQEIKTLLRRLKRDNPNIEKSIFNSIHTVALDTFPGYKTKGEVHSFLEHYDH